MSLLKQLFLAICLFLVVAFSGSFVSSVENSREQLRGQLRSHAQDAATALGLSLTPHVDDPAMVQLMVSSIFDSGYFASIRVIDIKSGKPLVERVQAHAERTVPGWFERLVDLQPQGGDALIMRGWEQAARVEVVSHPQFALARLWDSALGSLYWLLACGAAEPAAWRLAAAPPTAPARPDGAPGPCHQPAGIPQPAQAAAHAGAAPRGAGDEPDGGETSHAVRRGGRA